MRLARRQVALSLIVSILKNLNGSCTCQGQGLSDIDAIRKKGRATKIHDHNNVWWTLRSDKAQAHGNEQRKVTIDVICGRESCLCVCFLLLCLPLPVNTKHSNRKALQDTSLFPKHSFVPHIQHNSASPIQTLEHSHLSHYTSLELSSRCLTVHEKTSPPVSCTAA